MFTTAYYLLTGEELFTSEGDTGLGGSGGAVTKSLPAEIGRRVVVTLAVGGKGPRVVFDKRL